MGGIEETGKTQILQELGSVPAKSYLLSLVSSLLVSFLILFAIVQAKKTPIQKIAVPEEDLTTVFMPAPPPPPPNDSTTQDLPEPPSQLHIESEATSSPIQIPLTTDLKLVTEQPQIQPRLEFSLEAFRPDSQREQQRIPVFFVDQVDQRPTPIYKKIPNIDEKLVGQVDITRIRLVYIVTKEGEVKQVSLLHSTDLEFSNYVIEAAKKWRFNPAIKDGQKVNCWIRQGITLKPQKDNKFSLH